MEIQGWRYYLHAAIPTCAPHEIPNLEPVFNGQIFKQDKKAYIARYITDWDCGYETNWWYVIKDTPFNIDSLKAKRRYEINKGNKNFDVRKILVNEFAEQVYEVTKQAYESWPKKYRPSVEYEKFMKNLPSWNVYTAYGAFSKKDGSLCGYALLRPCGKLLDFCVLRVMPKMENQSINAAIVSGILNDNEELFKMGGYISDGSRNIRHETAFQDYLEKYFDFRKVYCKLNMVYSPFFGMLIKLIYPFRKIIFKFDGIRFVNKVSTILALENIVREQKVVERK